jgi:hypothetical protein
MLRMCAEWLPMRAPVVCSAINTCSRCHKVCVRRQGGGSRTHMRMHMAVLMQAAPGLAGLYDSLTTSVDAVMGTGVSRALGTRVFMLFCLALSACYCIIMGICITCLT